MKKYISCYILFFSIWLTALSQHTFSIVAVDTATGEIGSAGASCIDGSQVAGGVLIISGILPGRGAVNAQATVCIPNSNLNNAMAWMELGNNPQQILDSLLTNDACIFGTTLTRQYGIVDLDTSGNARSVGYTGSDAMDYKNHNTGYNYSIQGNILLGQEILDSMEAGFLLTQGSLAHKLMGALQGANVPGADTRCLGEGVSSLSSYLRVAAPTDTNTFTVDLLVEQTPFGIEPIDSLQSIFDDVVGPPDTIVPQDTLTGIDGVKELSITLDIFPNPVASMATIAVQPLQMARDLQIIIYDLLGNEVAKWDYNSKPVLLQRSQLRAGLYIVHLTKNGEVIYSRKLTIL